MAYDPQEYLKTRLALSNYVQNPPDMSAPVAPIGFDELQALAGQPALWEVDELGRRFRTTSTGARVYAPAGTAPAPAPAPAAAPELGQRSGFMGLWGKRVTPGTTEAAMLEQRRQLEAAGLVSGIGQAAQLGATFVPTAQDAYNRRRMQEVEARQAQIQRELKTRDFGLSAEERQLMENTAIAPVMTLARESRLNEEAALASMGGTSAAAQVRAQREARRTVAEQARQAALGIEGADIRLAQQQIADLKAEDQALRGEQEERYAYKSERAKGRLQAGVATIGALGEIMGRTMAGKGQSTLDPITLQGLYGLNDDEAKVLAGIEDEATRQRIAAQFAKMREE